MMDELIMQSVFKASGRTTDCHGRPWQKREGVFNAYALESQVKIERDEFESVISALQGDVAYAGTQFTIDSAARASYVRQIGRMANELRTEVLMGHMTWRQAAEQANATRNTIMEIMRGKSTPVGRAIAEQLKSQGKTLNEILAKKATSLYGNGVVFGSLSDVQKNKVYAEVVKSAGKSNPAVTAKMARYSRAGRGLIFAAIAISVYNIATAENKVRAAKKEIAVTGGGVLGGLAGGALAGLACGPGAPVCVTIGAFVGGALGAMGVDLLW